MPALDSGYNPAPYPDPAVQTVDPAFRKLVIGNAGLERLYTGCRWAEGPVWVGDSHSVLWSDIPNNRILRWSAESGEVSVFRQPASYANGNTRDCQGRLLSCEHDTRAISRTDYDGSVHILIDSFEGKRLNAPNDVVVHRDGSIWFSDPGYGIDNDYEGNKAEHELPARVYMHDPETGETSIALDDLLKPNGLCFSPDYSLLYVADSGVTHDANCPRRIWAYPLLEGSRLGKPSVFADLGNAMPDGLRCDTEGNIWTSGAWTKDSTNGVWVYDPTGKLLGRIQIPEPISNLCFGGQKRNRLFITASRSLYAIYVNARGTVPWEG